MCKSEESRMEPGHHNKHSGWSEKQFVVGLSNSYFSGPTWKAHRESSWLGRLICRVLSFPTPSPPPPQQQQEKNTSKNSNGIGFCFFLKDKSHSSINDECLFLESKQLSQTVISIPVHNGWGRELGPKPHVLPHFHCAYQIPKHILKADLWNGDSGMEEGNFTKIKKKKKKSSLTLIDLAILWTKHLPTGQNYSLCLRRVWCQEPAIIPYRWVHGDVSTVNHATANWWASYISKTWHHIELFDCYF